MNRLARIAVVQGDCTLGDKARNLKRAAILIDRAAEQDAALVLFPEMYLTGYLLQENTRELAETVSGPSIKKLAKIAQSRQISICMGFPELEPSNREIFNSAVCLSDQGEILTVYRKIHLYDEEKKYFSVGSEIKIAETAIGRAGFLICYDLEFPELARMITLKGTDVLLVSTANMKPWGNYQDVYVKARAMENQIFLALANRVGKEKNLVFCGNSVVVDPMGQILAGADMQDPALLIADIDLSSIRKARSGGVNYLRDRRPEIYQLLS